MSFRDQIARILNLRDPLIHVAPAIPRVTDAVIDGVDCLTVIAVEAYVSTEKPAPQRVILDCRALLDGWLTWPILEGQVLQADMLRAVRLTIPLGYDAILDNVNPEATHVPAVTGHVFRVTCVHRPVLLADLAANPAEAVQIPADLTVVDAIAALHRVLDDNTDVEASAGSADRDVSGRVQVIVVVPDYLPELHEPQVTFPVTEDSFTAIVRNLRTPVDVRRFPNLIAANPQPDPRFATYCALPHWDSTQRCVIIDSRQVDERVFAVMAPTSADLGIVYALADISPDQQVVILAGHPHTPMDYGRFEPVAHGDLFTVVPFLAEQHPKHTLQEMLSHTAGWRAEDAFARVYGDRVYLVTEAEPVLFELNRRRARHFKRDVAAALGVNSSVLVLQPLHPPIRDFADRGRLARSVLLALTAQGQRCPFLLDMRPAHLGFQASSVPEGDYDVQALRMRLQPFCPSGYQVAVYGSFPLMRLTEAYALTPGSIIVVEFEAVCDSQHEAVHLLDGRLANDVEETNSTTPPSSGPTGDRTAQSSTSQRRQPPVNGTGRDTTERSAPGPTATTIRDTPTVVKTADDKLKIAPQKLSRVAKWSGRLSQHVHDLDTDRPHPCPPGFPLMCVPSACDHSYRPAHFGARADNCLASGHSATCTQDT